MNEERAPFFLRLCQSGRTLVAALGGWLNRLADRVSPPNMRATRRKVRRWLSEHGLTIVLVSAMMVAAWIIAER